MVRHYPLKGVVVELRFPSVHLGDSGALFPLCFLCIFGLHCKRDPSPLCIGSAVWLYL
jgi:hypothetical protein